MTSTVGAKGAPTFARWGRQAGTAPRPGVNGNFGGLFSKRIIFADEDNAREGRRMAANPDGHGPLGMAEAARLYVEHVRGLRLAALAVEAELRCAREGSVRAQSLSPASGGGGPLHGDDAVFRLVASYAELSAELEAREAELAGEREEFARCVGELPDPVHRALLSMRAAGGTWAEAASRLHYSRSHLMRLAESAYVALWAAMPEQWRRTAFPSADEREELRGRHETQ